MSKQITNQIKADPDQMMMISKSLESQTTINQKIPSSSEEDNSNDENCEKLKNSFMQMIKNDKIPSEDDICDRIGSDNQISLLAAHIQHRSKSLIIYPSYKNKGNHSQTYVFKNNHNLTDSVKKRQNFIVFGQFASRVDHDDESSSISSQQNDNYEIKNKVFVQSEENDNSDLENLRGTPEYQAKYYLESLRGTPEYQAKSSKEQQLIDTMIRFQSSRKNEQRKKSNPFSNQKRKIYNRSATKQSNISKYSKCVSPKIVRATTLIDNSEPKQKKSTGMISLNSSPSNLDLITNRLSKDKRTSKNTPDTNDTNFIMSKNKDNNITGKMSLISNNFTGLTSKTPENHLVSRASSQHTRTNLGLISKDNNLGSESEDEQVSVLSSIEESDSKENHSSTSKLSVIEQNIDPVKTKLGSKENLSDPSINNKGTKKYNFKEYYDINNVSPKRIQNHLVTQSSAYLIEKAAGAKYRKQHSGSEKVIANNENGNQKKSNVKKLIPKTIMKIKKIQSNSGTSGNNGVNKKSNKMLHMPGNAWTYDLLDQLEEQLELKTTITKKRPSIISTKPISGTAFANVKNFPSQKINSMIKDETHQVFDDSDMETDMKDHIEEQELGEKPTEIMGKSSLKHLQNINEEGQKNEIEVKKILRKNKTYSHMNNITTEIMGKSRLKHPQNINEEGRKNEIEVKKILRKNKTYSDMNNIMDNLYSNQEDKNTVTLIQEKELKKKLNEDVIANQRRVSNVTDFSMISGSNLNHINNNAYSNKIEDYTPPKNGEYHEGQFFRANTNFIAEKLYNVDEENEVESPIIDNRKLKFVNGNEYSLGLKSENFIKTNDKTPVKQNSKNRAQMSPNKEKNFVSKEAQLLLKMKKKDGFPDRPEDNNKNSFLKSRAGMFLRKKTSESILSSSIRNASNSKQTPLTKSPTKMTHFGLSGQLKTKKTNISKDNDTSEKSVEPTDKEQEAPVTKSLKGFMDRLHNDFKNDNIVDKKFMSRGGSFFGSVHGSKHESSMSKANYIMSKGSFILSNQQDSNQNIDENTNPQFATMPQMNHSAKPIQNHGNRQSIGSDFGPSSFNHVNNDTQRHSSFKLMNNRCDGPSLKLTPTLGQTAVDSQTIKTFEQQNTQYSNSQLQPSVINAPIDLTHGNSKYMNNVSSNLNTNSLKSGGIFFGSEKNPSLLHSKQSNSYQDIIIPTPTKDKSRQEQLALKDLAYEGNSQTSSDRQTETNDCHGLIRRNSSAQLRVDSQKKKQNPNIHVNYQQQPPGQMISDKSFRTFGTPDPDGSHNQNTQSGPCNNLARSSILMNQQDNIHDAIILQRRSSSGNSIRRNLSNKLESNRNQLSHTHTKTTPHISDRRPTVNAELSAKKDGIVHKTMNVEDLLEEYHYNHSKSPISQNEAQENLIKRNCIFAEDLSPEQNEGTATVKIKNFNQMNLLNSPKFGSRLNSKDTSLKSIDKGAVASNFSKKSQPGQIRPSISSNEKRESLDKQENYLVQRMSALQNELENVMGEVQMFKQNRKRESKFASDLQQSTSMNLGKQQKPTKALPYNRLNARSNNSQVSNEQQQKHLMELDDNKSQRRLSIANNQRISLQNNIHIQSGSSSGVNSPLNSGSEQNQQQKHRRQAPASQKNIRQFKRENNGLILKNGDSAPEHNNQNKYSSNIKYGKRRQTNGSLNTNNNLAESQHVLANLGSKANCRGRGGLSYDNNKSDLSNESHAKTLPKNAQISE